MSLVALLPRRRESTDREAQTVDGHKNISDAAISIRLSDSSEGFVNCKSREWKSRGKGHC